MLVLEETSVNKRQLNQSDMFSFFFFNFKGNIYCYSFHFMYHVRITLIMIVLFIQSIASVPRVVSYNTFKRFK